MHRGGSYPWWVVAVQPLARMHLVSPLFHLHSWRGRGPAFLKREGEVTCPRYAACVRAGFRFRWLWHKADAHCHVVLFHIIHTNPMCRALTLFQGFYLCRHHCYDHLCLQVFLYFRLCPQRRYPGRSQRPSGRCVLVHTVQWWALDT